MKDLLRVSWIAGWILSLAACASPTPAPAPASLAPTTVLPTAVPMPTVFAPSVAEFPHPGGADTAGDEAPPGQYKSPVSFSVPFTFQTHQIYRGVYEGFVQAQLFGLAQGRAHLPTKLLLFWALDPRYSVDQVISQLRATANMTRTANQGATVASLSGTQFDATAEHLLAIPALGAFVGHAGDDWQTNSPQVHLRFIALPLAGRVLLIYIEAPQEEFDAFVADAQHVLGTVHFAARTS